MPEHKIEAFIAYASQPRQLAQLITEAVRRANQGGGRYTSWEENDVAGRPLTAPIFSGLDEANLLVADVTTLNFNVTFEIGYAIGAGRRVFLTKCSEYEGQDELINRIGIF